MAVEGKGFFIWKIKECENGNAERIADAAVEAGLGHVLIKVADRTSAYNIDRELGIDLVPPVVQALKAVGMQVWGWQYIYGTDPLTEARRAAQRVRQLSMDGFVVNAEAEFKKPGMDAPAKAYMRELRDYLPDIPVALSTYRFPSYHPQFPYNEFLKRCDYNMPQVYWQGAHNPASQLTKSLREFQNLQHFRPFIPTGSAYAGDGWIPKPEDMLSFLQTARRLNLKAANFWSWDYARLRLPQVWKTISEYPWSGTPKPKDIVERYIEALNTGDPDQIAALYTPTGVHVNATRTILGTDAVRTWYHELTGNILHNAHFSLTGTGGTGNSRHLTWTASSPIGNVYNGNDTFGLKDGKIAYHFTFFTIDR
jgi:hypothetical protein